MIAFGLRSKGEARRRAYSVDGEPYYKSEWMESERGVHPCPTIFLVEQPPNTLLAPHFHEENQFQVFVEGSGSIGPHPIVPVMVHYAGAYTGYGPVMSGPNGLKYFTIRPEFDAGHLPIADARGLNPRGPKVHAQGYVPGGVAIQDKIGHDLALFPPPTAGVHANAIWLPAMATEFFDAPPRNGGGMFYFVVEGSVQSGSTILDRWECVFTDEPIELIAGLHGALLLALGTAARDSQYDGIRICSH